MAEDRKQIRQKLGANIKKFRERDNFTQILFAEEISKKLGKKINPMMVSHWENGLYSPNMITLKAICDIFNVSLNEMYGEYEAFSIEGVLPIKTKKFRLLGDIACGDPIQANEEVELYIDANAEIKADFVLHAKGDSMINARIFDGDYVFIRQQDMVENGEIAAVLIDNAVTLKRVFFYPEQEKIILQAENPNYAPLSYSRNEIDEIRILGKAIAFQSIVR